MRDYYVHFSYYDEVWGAFEDNAYPVSAESPFAAREKAWVICDADKETPLRSNIKQYAVTWEPDPLNIGDYFYAYAADIKQSLGSLMNVTIPNDEILGIKRNEVLQSERKSFLSSLYTVGEIANDLYGAKGILPPSIYEELHYAEKLYEHICGNHYDDKAEHLWEMIKKAKAWDYGAIYALRDLFQNGYTTLCGNTERFREHFGKDGLYPVHDNLDDWDWIYIRRWKDKKDIKRMSQLPLFSKNDCIKNSVHILNEGWHYAVLNHEVLNEEYRKPENMIWQVAEPTTQNSNSDPSMLQVENPVTGQKMSCLDKNFVGALRPDIVSGIEFEELSKEYAASKSIPWNCEEMTMELGEDYGL